MSFEEDRSRPYANSRNTRRDLVSTGRVLITFLMYPVGLAAAALALVSTQTANRMVFYSAWSLTGGFALLAGCRAMLAARYSVGNENQRFVRDVGKQLLLCAGMTVVLIILMTWHNL